MFLRLILEHEKLEREKVLSNKSSALGIEDSKKEALQDVTTLFTAMYPDHHPRSQQQLRTALAQVQRK